VPEIYDGTVVIKVAVREPGERAKIAVDSNERDVDPVGACVGMKGSRVQTIIRELRGEKIDIIEWAEEPSVFAANALSPAKVNQVRITDIDMRQMEVIVNEDQLSLAIGKRGQNVRLATKLVGWNIDIRSEDDVKREVAQQMGAMISSGESVPLTVIEGLNSAMTATMAEHGIVDIQGLAAASIDQLTEYLDVSLDDAQKMLDSAQIVMAAGQQSETPADELQPTDELQDEQNVASSATGATSAASATSADEQIESDADSNDQPVQIAETTETAEAVEATKPGEAEEVASVVDDAMQDGINASPDDATPDNGDEIEEQKTS
ncbi:MAG: transcription termination factor NusA, partial [Pyrinomonadaceae bacterium]